MTALVKTTNSICEYGKHWGESTLDLAMGHKGLLGLVQDTRGFPAYP